MSSPRTGSETQSILKAFGRSISCALCFFSSRGKSVKTTTPTWDSVPPEIRRRRVALQACGLLEQSRIYGDSRLYRDEVPDAGALSSTEADKESGTGVCRALLLLLHSLTSITIGRITGSH